MLRLECHATPKGKKRKCANEKRLEPPVGTQVLCSESLCPACIAAVNEMRAWTVRKMVAIIAGTTEPDAKKFAFLDYPRFSQKSKLC